MSSSNRNPQQPIQQPYVKRTSKSIQWIGLREHLQENPIFNGKIYGFL